MVGHLFHFYADHSDDYRFERLPHRLRACDCFHQRYPQPIAIRTCRNINAKSHTYTDTNSHIYSDCDTYSDCNIDADSDGYGDANSYTYGDRAAHAYAEIIAYTATSSDSGSSPVAPIGAQRTAALPSRALRCYAFLVCRRRK